MKYKIGTRGSKLALIQAGQVCDRLKRAYPEHEFEIQVIHTKGDRIQDRPLDKIGDKGLFVREIEEKILAGEVHIGVHSMKDMPTETAPGLCFTKAWKREDPRDVLILRKAESLEELPQGAVIATGSKRREYQLRQLRPDIQVVGIRGNVDTRIRKMEEQKLDGIVLAAAGLHRLGMQERITCYLEPEQMIPAPAQGVLALEIRQEDETLGKMLDVLSDADTNEEAETERYFLRYTGGNCQVPVGAFCVKEETGQLTLQALCGREDGTRLTRVTVTGDDPEELAAEAFRKITGRLAGKVYLVGGGPGDPGLITVKGRQILRCADCIIYDRLSSPALLHEAKSECEKIYVGKENHHHTMSQEKINQLLIEKAMQYDRVVRLKGGDVYVFGRGGEEALALCEQGISFEIIPGVSSATAGLAYAGIPVTHRGTSGGFHVVTAHNRKDELANLDFEAMARGNETCVFLMGLGKLGEIAEGLMQAGMSPHMPAAVISHATMPDQQVCTAPLNEIEREVKEAGIESPALIVVGEVIRFRERLNFWETKPLFGKKYWIPVIGEETTELAKKLAELGAGVREIKAGNIRYHSALVSEKQLSGIDWLIFTSRHGVMGFFEDMRRAHRDARELAHIKVAAIGKATEKCLKKYGIYADFVPDRQNSDGLAEGLCQRLTGSECVCCICPENGNHHLREQMEHVCEFQEIPVYENIRLEKIALPEYGSGEWESAHGIVFTCGSSAERFLECLTSEQKSRLKDAVVFSIGSRTTETLYRLGVHCVVEAERSDYEGLILAILQEADARK